MPAEQILSGTKPPLYLLDSYALIYRSYFAFLSRPLRNNNGENISALFGFARALVTLLDAESAKRKILLAAVLDSKKPTFRHERYPSYKATREKAPQELHDQVGKVEQFLAFLGIAALRLDGYEADDLIATLASRCRNEGRECYIYSSDKDLLQLVGGGVYQLRQSRVSQTPMLECVDAALVKAEWGVNPDKILDLLSLTGDSADNVPGVKGVGAILAKKLLARFGSLDAIYENISVLTGAAPKKLAEGRENAFLSRELIRLVHDVPLNVADIDDFSIENLDRAAAARFLLSEGIPSVARQLVPELEDGGGAAERERKPAAAGGTESQPEKLLDGEELTGPGKYRVIVDLGELEGYFALAAAQGYMALDFETDSLDAWHANPVGISFALKPKEGFYVPMMRHGGEEDCLAPDAVRALLEPLFADGAFTVVAHNAKYDYAVSRGWGIPRWKAKIYDTMIAAWLCDTERSGFSLDSLSFSYLGYQALSYDSVVPRGKIFSDVPLDLACRYSAEDADLCMRMRELFIARLSRFGSDALFTDIEMPLLPILAEMEGTGIKIEGGPLQSYGRELAVELTGIEAETWQLVGHEFNLASPKQLQEVLFTERHLQPIKKTKTGWSTDVAVLEELSREDRVPELILQHRTLSKLKTTYVDTLGGMADSKGRLHTSFIQTGTATGRLSSRDPNLQNIPVREDGGRRIREAFVAGEGCALVSADYNQIELVILAHLSGDKNLVEAFNAGLDVHTRTAARIFGVDEAEIDTAKRRVAKTINFGVMYGMSAFRLSQELKISRSEAADFIDTYFRTYSGVREFIDNLIRGAEKNGFVSTLFGRRRSVPAINSRNRTEKGAAERIAVNTPIQGTAADIVKKAMIDVDAALCAAPWTAPASAAAGYFPPRMLLQVHDELILECFEEDAERTGALVRRAMEEAVSLTVPLRVSVETGKRWGDFH